MKRIKIGVAIIFLTVGVYFIISYSIFWFKKSSVDKQLQSAEKEGVAAEMIQPEGNVAIQRVVQDDDTDIESSDEDSNNSDELVVSSESENPLPVIMAEKEREFIITSDRAVENKKPVKLDSYSFVTMPIADDYEIDIETQRTLDALMGKDLDAFVKLVLQSNNNVVSAEACRSCGIYALFSILKKHQSLPLDEIVVLQKMLANLYQFVETTKSLSKSNKPLLLLEQYQALQDLNRSQSEKNVRKLQARRAATSAAFSRR